MNGTFIYFARPVGVLTPIKIGCSSTPEGRLETFAAWSPVRLEIFLKFPGGLDLERNIHECFAHCYSHKEWFHPDAAMQAAIERLQAGERVDVAIDLTKRGTLPEGLKKGAKSASSERRWYQVKLGWAIKKASTDEMQCELPDDAHAIVQRWRQSIEPTDAEKARLDAVLAAPLEHLVQLERFPQPDQRRAAA